MPPRRGIHNGTRDGARFQLGGLWAAPSAQTGLRKAPLLPFRRASSWKQYESSNLRALRELRSHLLVNLATQAANERALLKTPGTHSRPAWLIRKLMNRKGREELGATNLSCLADLTSAPLTSFAVHNIKRTNTAASSPAHSGRGLAPAGFLGGCFGVSGTPPVGARMRQKPLKCKIGSMDSSEASEAGRSVRPHRRCSLYASNAFA